MPVIVTTNRSLLKAIAQRHGYAFNDLVAAWYQLGNNLGLLAMAIRLHKANAKKHGTTLEESASCVLEAIHRRGEAARWGALPAGAAEARQSDQGKANFDEIAGGKNRKLYSGESKE